MITDIHTHQLHPSHPAVRNLFPEIAEAELSMHSSGLFSVGLHPWYAGNNTADQLRLVEKWSHDPRVVLIGECGLDKHADASLQMQTEVLKHHIRLSEEVKKPLILHCVGCFNELLALARLLKPRQTWIIHGFRGKPELARQLLRAGCAISLGEHFNPETAAVIPPEKLFAESDESSLSFEKICNRIAEAHSVGSGKTELTDNFSRLIKT